MKAAEIYEKNLKEPHDATTRYVEAARAYKNVNTAAAIKYYGIAVDMHMEGNKFSTAAKLYKDIAELYEKDMEFEGAKQAYTKAADCQRTHCTMHQHTQPWRPIGDVSELLQSLHLLCPSSTLRARAVWL